MATISKLTPDSHAHARNPGLKFSLDAVEDTHVNLSAVERRAKTLGGRRTVKKEYQAAWLLKAISCIDLTTLSGMIRRAVSNGYAPKPANRYARIFLKHSECPIGI
nr:hypothetical protein [Sneathiella glossodoripedis]